MIGGSLGVGLVLGLLSLRGRERDSAIGAVLAFGLGVGVLFLSLYQGYATEATNLLFGSIVGVSDRQVLELAIVAAIVLTGVVALYRPLLFSSVDPEVAEARGVPMRALSVAVFLLLALTTAEAIQVVGVLLVLTLVITPAAAAQRLTVAPARRAPARHRDRARRDGGRDPALARAPLADELLHQRDLVRGVRRRPGRERARPQLIVTPTARMFSSRCATFDVPGIGEDHRRAVEQPRQLVRGARAALRRAGSTG